MKKLITLPTYILYRIMQPYLSEDNPLSKKVNLEQWYNNSTDLNKAFAIYFWITPIIITTLLCLV